MPELETIFEKKLNEMVAKNTILDKEKQKLIFRDNLMGEILPLL